MKHSATWSRNRLALAVAFATTAATSSIVIAQEEIEEIQVTGSFISRPADRPAPVSVIDNSEIMANQRVTITEVLRDMPMITNANTANLGSNVTNSINLRGLGDRSTLVLLNGERVSVDANGNSAVDINNLAPAIMIERVEILLDGASALYGSDAVAGVANFITRNNFEGSEISFSTQIAEAQTSVPEITVGGIFGAQGADSSIVMAVEWYGRADRLDSQQIRSKERLEHGLTTALWNPGSFFGSTTPGWFVDPLCDSPLIGGSPGNDISDPAGYRSGPFCRGLLSLQRSFIPESERLTGMAVATRDLNWDHVSSITLETNFAMEENTSSYGTGVPLLALNSTNTILPATNPGVIDANQRDPNFPLQNYNTIFSRQLSPLEGALSEVGKQWNYRTALTVDGLINDAWDWKVSGTYSQNDQWTQIVDTIADRMSRALQGYGGPACKYNLATGPDSALVQAGVGSCQYWNPFASRLIANPGDPTYNDPALLDWMQYGDTTLGEANFFSVEGLVTGELWEMAGGATGVALGVQYRKQEIEIEIDPIRKDGGYGFSTQAFTDWQATRDTNAIFGELVMYPSETLELDFAARYEDTLGETSIEPKISVLYTPTENLFIRASAGSSFRQPSEVQLFGNGGANPARRAVGGETIQANAIALGSRDLKPEESDNWTIGFTWDMTENFTIEATWWDYQFTNLVAAESSAAILENDYQSGFITDPRNELFPNRPNEVCEITGRWDPATGVANRPADCITGFDFAIFRVGYENQDAIETNGLDFTIDYSMDLLGGDFNTRLVGTWVNEYRGVDTTTGTLRDAVGTNAFGFSGINSNPEMQANWVLQYRKGSHYGRISTRYLTGIENTNPDPLAADNGEGSYTQVDLSYSYDLPTDNPSTLSLGMINALDREPPLVDNGLTTVNTGLYEGRGRLFRASVNYNF